MYKLLIKHGGISFEEFNINKKKSPNIYKTNLLF
jgi:hypothetical protein